MNRLTDVFDELQPDPQPSREPLSGAPTRRDVGVEDEWLEIERHGDRRSVVIEDRVLDQLAESVEQVFMLDEVQRLARLRRMPVLEDEAAVAQADIRSRVLRFVRSLRSAMQSDAEQWRRNGSQAVPPAENPF